MTNIMHIPNYFFILIQLHTGYTIPGNNIFNLLLLLLGTCITVQVWSFESWLERKWIREEMTEVGDNT